MPVVAKSIKYGNGSAGDNRNITAEVFCIADTVADYIDHIAKRPMKDSIVTFHSLIEGDGLPEASFFLDSLNITRNEPTPEGKIYFVEQYSLRYLNIVEQEKAKLPPWVYPISDYSVQPATEETAIEWIYPPNSLAPKRFCNTAGVMLEAGGIQGLCTISFSYNSLYFDENAVWGFKSTTNAFPITIAGMNFGARVLLVENYSGTEQIEYDEDGNIKWRYFKISVTLTANPKTWNKQYLNLGTHVWTNGGLEQLWKWIDDDGRTHFEPYSSFLHWVDNQRGDESRGEAVTEPMFLNSLGTGISGFRGYEQIPTYIEGCPFYPADFSFLDLPATRGWRN